MKLSASFLLIIMSIAIFVSANTTATKELSPRFNHVMLYVSDLEASIEFYTKAFDLDVAQRLNEISELTEDGESPRPVKMAFLKFPGQEFVFELAERNVEGDDASRHFQHVGIDVTNIEQAARRLKQAGGANYSGIRHLRANDTEVKNCFFTGPDGEQIELMQILAGEF